MSELELRAAAYWHAPHGQGRAYQLARLSHLKARELDRLLHAYLATWQALGRPRDGKYGPARGTPQDYAAGYYYRTR